MAMTTTAVRYHETGGPEVLRVEEVEVPEPGPGQALVRHAAIGVNSPLTKSALDTSGLV